MQKISLSEFSRCCSAQPYTRFILSTDNQAWDKIDNTMRMEFEFNSISVSYNPNIISLSLGSNYMSFERVKYIKIEESSILGTVYTIVCGNPSVKSDDFYTIIAR